MGNTKIKYNLEDVNYDIVECPNKRFTAEAKDKLEEVLTIRRDGNIIILCHPRHVFDGIKEDAETRFIDRVDWDSINIEKMKEQNDYGKYSMVEQLCTPNHSQFTYFKKRVKHVMENCHSKGIDNPICPVAIIEGVYNTQTDSYNYYARGIICATKNGYAFGKSPNYVYLGHKESVWEKALRMGDNYNL